MKRLWTFLTSWISPAGAYAAWLAVVAVAIWVVLNDTSDIAFVAVLALLIAAWALQVTVGQAHRQEKRDANAVTAQASFELFISHAAKLSRTDSANQLVAMKEQLEQLKQQNELLLSINRRLEAMEADGQHRDDDD